jgi:predicted AlkP superfamily pyrophosphatase or phosphodiesterase
MSQFLPDYDGGSIVNLMASIAAGFGADRRRYAELRLLSGHAVAQAKDVVLFVIDGLGFDFLKQHAELTPHLNTHLLGSITSVFPSTTAAGIGTYLTGVAPIEHGLTGWHMYLRELAAVLAVLPGRGRSGANHYKDGDAVHALLRTTPFADRLPVKCHMIAPASIADSPFNRAHSGKSAVAAYDTLEEMFDYTRQALNGPDRNYVYSYWPDLDSTGHRYGMGSEPTLNLLRELDAAFGEFVQACRGNGTMILLSADHGHVNSGAAYTHVLNDYPKLASKLLLPLCGEPRAAYAYVRGHNECAFIEEANTVFGTDVVIRRSEEILSEGWFGPGEAHPELASRVGDFLLLPTTNRMVRDWLPGERPYALASAHGGLSAAEMHVPLVLVPPY